jgi:hypothetical protein
MEWDIYIHKKEGYLEIITRGEANQDSSLLMAKTITNNMRRNLLIRVLIDHRNIGSVSGRVTEIYNRPKILKLIGAIMKIRVAEVIKPEHRKHFHFFETVCLNQGYSVSIFQEKEEALEWLLRK